MKILLNISFLILFVSQIQAVNLILPGTDSTGNKIFKVPVTTEKIKTDGLLKEPFWQQALKIELPYEVQPGDNIPAPVKTEVYIIHTENNLYIGFKAYDPEPEKIRAHFNDRDRAFSMRQFYC